ncbi:MAG: dockerin type I repeat-containing protein [Gemmatimonadota bacterium]|nr:MAG: dockerin type I repeat-containing protein [Gemmatimonadota bacterium]
MRKQILVVSLLIGVFLLHTGLWGQLFEENFDYLAGDALTDHGWTQIRSGTPITVSTPGLTYPGYSLSSIGNAASLVTGNGQEVKNTFTEQTNDSLYVSFLINVGEATTANDGIYFYLGPTDISIFSRRLTAYVRKDTSDNLAFGVAKNSGIGFTGFSYSMNTTHLIVMKYKFNPDTDDDEVSLWVDPLLSGSEPPPDRTISSGSDASELAEIVLSQLTASNTAPTAEVDGIRITTSWFEGQRGDCNGDGDVDLLDIITAVNHILGVTVLEGVDLWAADCNGDGDIDLLDLIGIANVILGLGECEP